MINRVSTYGFGLFAALLLTACAAETPSALVDSKAIPLVNADGSVTFQLTGQGSSSDAPLSATVKAYVHGPDELELQITNDSPAASPHLDDAPVLTRLAFNLTDVGVGRCLSLGSEGDGARFTYTTKTKPFCGVAGDGDRFAYGVNAKNPVPSHGVARGETVSVTLHLDTRCAGDFEFTPEALLEAPLSPAGGELVRIVAKFQVVGADGEDSGCALGQHRRPPVYIWSEFAATAAEIDPQPSIFRTDDTRAGSVELNFNGRYGFDGVTTDAPYSAGILNLRNGAGSVLEQWQINRARVPHSLDAEGCNTNTATPQCWLFPEAGDEIVSATVPTKVADSNVDFDIDPPARVTVAGELEIDTSGEPTDNGGQLIRVTWDDPNGLDTDRLNLRLHFDADLNGLLDDPWVPLYRVGWPGDGPDITDLAFVIVLHQDANSLTVEVNVQDAIEYVWDVYLGLPGYLP